MVAKLYKLDLSPPARAAMMACEIFNVPVEMVDLNLMANHHKTPEFLQKNPLHSIPTLEDGDFVLHDSHAILIYLADTYGKDDSWYPKEAKARALINQKLFFDTGILFPRLRAITYPIVIEGAKTVAQNLLDNVEEAYGFLEEFLSKTKYIAGDHVTIADLSIVSDVSTLQHILKINANKYPKILAWLRDMEKKPYCVKYNNPGSDALGELVKPCVN